MCTPPQTPLQTELEAAEKARAKAAEEEDDDDRDGGSPPPQQQQRRQQQRPSMAATLGVAAVAAYSSAQPAYAARASEAPAGRTGTRCVATTEARTRSFARLKESPGLALLAAGSIVWNLLGPLGGVIVKAAQHPSATPVRVSWTPRTFRAGTPPTPPERIVRMVAELVIALQLLPVHQQSTGRQSYLSALPTNADAQHARHHHRQRGMS